MTVPDLHKMCTTTPSIHSLLNYKQTFTLPTFVLICWQVSKMDKSSVEKALMQHLKSLEGLKVDVNDAANVCEELRMKVGKYGQIKEQKAKLIRVKALMEFQLVSLKEFKHKLELTNEQYEKADLAFENYSELSRLFMDKLENDIKFMNNSVIPNTENLEKLKQNRKKLDEEMEENSKTIKQLMDYKLIEKYH